VGAYLINHTQYRGSSDAAIVRTIQDCHKRRKAE
jgi:hypothetical protein